MKRVGILVLALCVCLMGFCAYASELVTISCDANEITSNDGTLAMSASCSEGDEFYWNIISGKDCAYIDADGILYAKANGTVKVLASLKSNPALSGVKEITITNQADDETQTASFEFTSRDNVRDLDQDLLVTTGTRYGTYTVGTRFNYTAAGVSAEARFLYWKDGKEERIITGDKDYSFGIATDTAVTANFRRDSSAMRLVEFRNANGVIILSKYLQSGGTVTVPQDPTSLTGAFSGWTLNGSDAAISAGDVLSYDDTEADRIFTAKYTPRTDEVTVSVTGGTGSGTYKVGSEVTVSADSAAIPSGQVFAFWLKDGEIASSDSTYSFAADTDCTVSAVYLDSAVEADNVFLFMHTPENDGSSLVFTCERTIKPGADIIENGIILSKSQNTELYSPNKKIIRKSYSKQDSVAYSMKVNNASAGTYWARGYIMYSDENGIHIVYTKPVSITVE